MAGKEGYIPALKFDFLTPVYDPALRWLMHEGEIKESLIRQADIQAGQRVLDLGCGTGTLTVLIKRLHPEAEVVGLDGDEQVLEIARAKTKKAGVELTLDQGMAYDLPYPDGSFERVLSSLMFHHLTTENKLLALLEAYRVLRPGGRLHMIDFGVPQSLWARWISPLMARLEEAGDHHKGLFPTMIVAAGFEQVSVMPSFSTIFGALAFYQGRKPG
jgi:ubiquinone/menaquinone biosynthesis C-methylase UbiE